MVTILPEKLWFYNHMHAWQEILSNCQWSFHYRFLKCQNICKQFSCKRICPTKLPKTRFCSVGWILSRLVWKSGLRNTLSHGWKIRMLICMQITANSLERLRDKVLDLSFCIFFFVVSNFILKYKCYSASLKDFKIINWKQTCQIAATERYWSYPTMITIFCS